MKKQVIETGWKLTNGDMTSWWVGSWCSEGILSGGTKVYKLGVKQRPKKGCGPLAVFVSREDAVQHLLEGNHLFRCSFKRSRKRTVWVGKERRPLVRLLPGTVLADWVRLEEEV